MKTVAVWLSAIFLALALVKNFYTIFPVMEDDQYFIDDYNQIHNNKCPYKSVPWFTEKRNKYDFIKHKNWRFCKECFSDEEIDKLYVISDYNIDIFVTRLQNMGCKDDYINEKIKDFE